MQNGTLEKTMLTSKQKIIWTDVAGKPVQPNLNGLAKQDANGQLVTIVPVKPNYNKAMQLCGECQQ